MDLKVVGFILSWVTVIVTYLVREARREEKVNSDFIMVKHEIAEIKEGLKVEHDDHKKKHEELEKVNKFLISQNSEKDIVFTEIKVKMDNLERLLLEQGKEQKEISAKLLETLLKINN